MLLHCTLYIGLFAVDSALGRKRVYVLNWDVIFCDLWVLVIKALQSGKHRHHVASLPLEMSFASHNRNACGLHHSWDTVYQTSLISKHNWEHSHAEAFTSVWIIHYLVKHSAKDITEIIWCDKKNDPTLISSKSSKTFRLVLATNRM